MSDTTKLVTGFLIKTGGKTIEQIIEEAVKAARKAGSTERDGEA